MPTDKRERQRANRAAKQAAEEKQARRAKTRRTIIRWGTLGVMVAILLTAFNLLGGDDSTPDTTVTTAATTDESATTLATENADTAADSPVEGSLGAAGYDEYRAQPTACGAEAPPARTEMTFDAPEDMGISGTVTAVINTSCGPITLELDAEASPATVNSFVFLAEQGFFNGTACHRFLDGFVLQCGDPTATGTGDAGYEIPDEFPDEGFQYERGVVAMANAGPGTTGSQFFIVTGDASALPAQFSILGRVVDSEETLAALDEVVRGVQPGTGEPSAPLETIYIESVEIRAN